MDSNDLNRCNRIAEMLAKPVTMHAWCIVECMDKQSEEMIDYLEAAKKAGQTVHALVQAGVNPEQALQYQCKLFVKSLPDDVEKNESFVAMMKDVIKTEAEK